MQVIPLAKERQNYNVVQLHVSEFNQKAQNLYEKHGFRRIDFIPDYYSPGDGAIVMELPM